MFASYIVCGGQCGEITFVMSQCHADLRGLGGKRNCAKHAGVNAACRWPVG